MFSMIEASLGIRTIDEQSVIKGFQEAVKSEYVQTQIFCVNLIESILQILSTVFIAIGRLQEIKTSKGEDDRSNG